MKAVVDQEACIGCGLCEETCPEVFLLDEEENHSTVIVDIIPPQFQECAQEAEENCPVSAITIE